MKLVVKPRGIDPSDRQAAVTAFGFGSKPRTVLRALEDKAKTSVKDDMYSPTAQSQSYAPTQAKQLSNLKYRLKQDQKEEANITTNEEIRTWAADKLVNSKAAFEAASK